MYNNLTIQGLRGITSLELKDFRQVNLFVGKNNCGKTTILEAIFLLTGPTNPQLPVKINSFRNYNIIDENTWSLIFNKMDVLANIKILGVSVKPEEKRELIINPNKKTLSTNADAVIDKEKINSEISYTSLSPSIDGLILEYCVIENSKKSKKIVTKIMSKGSKFEIDGSKDYRETLNGVYINAKTISGVDDIQERFNNIQIRKQTSRIIKILKQIEPSLDNLLLGKDGIIYCDIGLNYLMPIQIVGDGMFRLLSIVLAISDTANGIVLIDEIENGFHYSSQEILWNAIFKSAQEFNVQIFATTHSIECVKAFSSTYLKQTPDKDNIRLYRIERKNDHYKAVTYDHKTLHASLDSEWEVR